MKKESQKNNGEMISIKKSSLKNFFLGVGITLIILLIIGLGTATWYVGTQNIDMQGAKIVDLGTPTADAEAATKAYVDSNAAGGTTYEGVTSSTYTGDQAGSLATAQGYCDSAYSGSHICTDKDLLSAIPSTIETAWIVRDDKIWDSTDHCMGFSLDGSKTITTFDRIQSSSTDVYFKIAKQFNNYPLIGIYNSSSSQKLRYCNDVGCSSYTDVTVTSSGGFHGLTVRSDGRPIYAGKSGNYVNVYSCDDIDCSSVTQTQIDSTDVAFHINIAVRSDDMPFVSWYDTTLDDIKAYDCNDVDCTTGSTVLTLNSNAGTAGGYTHIAIRDDDRPIVSYFNKAYNRIEAYDCANSDCSSGTVRTIDSVSSYGYYNDIVIRQDGRPIISYYDYAATNLQVFDCADENCSSGTVRILDTNTVQGNSIDILPNGNPIVAYGRSSYVYYAICSNDNCTSKTNTLLDSASAIVYFPKIKVFNGDFAIAYDYYDSSNYYVKWYSPTIFGYVIADNPNYFSQTGCGSDIPFACCSG